MRIRFDRDEAVDALRSIVGVVPTRSPKPILLDVLVEASAAGVEARATDLEVSAGVRLPAAVDVPGSIALPAARLLASIRGLPAGEVVLDGGSISAGGYEIELVGHDPEEFPAAPADIEAPVPVDQAAFVRALRRVVVAASRDDYRRNLVGVHVHADELGRLVLAATDGQRLAEDSIPASAPVGLAGTVPVVAVEAVVHLLERSDEGGVFLGLTGTEISVWVGESSWLVARLLEGRYPRYRDAVPREFETTAHVGTEALARAVRALRPVVDPTTTTAVFRFDPAVGVRVSSRAKDVGEGVVEVAARVEGQVAEVLLQPGYVLAALEGMDDAEEVHVGIAAPDEPVVFRDGRTFLHMVMPMVQP